MIALSYDLDAVRAEIPILESLVPLNNCSQAPQSRRTRRAADEYLESWAEAGMDWDRWMEEVDLARATFARLVGGEAKDVAVVTSLSHATACIATGIDWSGARSKVVVSSAEFPTVGHVWRAQERFGAEVHSVAVCADEGDLSRYGAAIDDSTAIVSAAHGDYQTGLLQDIPAIAEVTHERDALLFVDAYQTLGSMPFDAPSSGADFVASGNLKFLMGIPGIAFLWVRPGLAERFEPAITGWFGRAEPFAFDAERLDWGDGARRFDAGTPPILEAYVARAGMEWLTELGLDSVGAWTRALAGRCVEGGATRGLTIVGPRDPSLRTATTHFACEDSHAVEVAMRERGIIASARGRAIRLAPHFYNTLDEIDHALDQLSEILG